MKQMISKLKRLFNWLLQSEEDFRELETRLQILEKAACNDSRRVDGLEHRFRQHSTVHADISYDRSTIIVVGKYRSHDFVEVFSIREAEFDQVVSMLQGMRRTNKVGKVDAPTHFKAYINHKLRY